MRFGPRELAVVFAGGMLGALARVAISQALPVTPGRWPWTTLAINVSGSFLLGYLAARLPEGSGATLLRPMLGAGFCGAYTTFSTVQLEMLRIADRGHGALAVGYALVSVAAGLTAVSAASALGRLPSSRAEQAGR